MNRPERRIADGEARIILKKGTFGVLSAVRENGAPYGVPLNYVYSEEENALIFHCAKAGLKTDCILHDSRVSFAVVGRADIDAQRFSTNYESVIVEGHAFIVDGDDEKRMYLDQLCEALVQSSPGRHEMIEEYLTEVTVVRVEIDSVCGKANRG
jgi:uncharacterized protein